MLKKSLSYVSVFSVIAAVCVVVLGAYTRLVDAGLGCPDWPTCYGHLWVPTSLEDIAKANLVFSDTPVEKDKTWPEQIHRIFASSLGLVLLFLFFSANLLRSQTSKVRQLNLLSLTLIILVVGVVKRVFFGELIEPMLALMLVIYFALLVRFGIQSNEVLGIEDDGVVSKRVFILISFLAGFVILQGLFGMWTVTLKLWPQVVTAHLLGGFIIFASISLLAISLSYPRLVFSVNRKTILLARIGLIAVFIQIGLGGWTSSNYAAMACPDLFTCQAQLLPHMDFQQGFNIFQQVGPNYLGGTMDNDARVAIHMTHRFGAIIVTLLLLALAVNLWTYGKPNLKSFALLLVLILVTQLGLGVSNIIFSLPLSIAVLHNAVGALLFTTLFVFNFLQFDSENSVE